MRRILDLATTGACQIAAEQRLQHQHPWIALTAFDLLFEDVSCHRPHLGNWYTHARIPWTSRSEQNERERELVFAFSLIPCENVDRKSTRLNSSHLGISYA